MKVKLVGWMDTGNIDVKLIAENDSDFAALAAMKHRAMRLGTTAQGELEIVFTSPVASEAT